MILADKIISLRKKSGWSQEELAEKLGVSRQSVSKWEGAQSAPDLNRILQLGQLFGVSTDYLLKDELETPEYSAGEEISSVRRVTLAEAGEFLRVKALTATRIALATLLCIFSPIPMMLMAAGADVGLFVMSEVLAGGLGLIIMIVLAAAAVAVFISCGIKTARFEFLEKEVFETEYGVAGLVSESRRRYAPTHSRSIVAGACICILSVIPLFSGVFFSENEFLMVLLLTVTMFLAGVGAALFITAGINWASFSKLLQDGEYSRELKRNGLPTGAIGTAFWLLATAVYLFWSFRTNDWQNTWIVWPLAGVIFAALMSICGAMRKKG